MRKICSSIIKFYSKHRNNVEDAFIVEKSFGQVVLDFSASGSSRQQVSQFSIISSQDGRVIYTRNSTLPKDGSVLRAQLADGCTWGVLSTQPVIIYLIFIMSGVWCTCLYVCFRIARQKYCCGTKPNLLLQQKLTNTRKIEKRE